MNREYVIEKWAEYIESLNAVDDREAEIVMVSGNIGGCIYNER